MPYPREHNNVSAAAQALLAEEVLPKVPLNANL